MRSSVFLGWAIVFGTAGITLAADQPPAGPPQPPAELGQLKDLQGKFKCTGQWFASAFGPARPTTGTFRTRSELGGFWIAGQFNERMSKKNPNPGHVILTFGYDPTGKQFSASVIDNFGGHAALTSAGWEGDTLTFTGTYVAGGQVLPYRDVYTRKAGELDHSGEVQGADGKWTPLNAEQCKR